MANIMVDCILEAVTGSSTVLYFLELPLSRHWRWKATLSCAILTALKDLSGLQCMFSVKTEEEARAIALFFRWNASRSQVYVLCMSNAGTLLNRKWQTLEHQNSEGKKT